MLRGALLLMAFGVAGGCSSVQQECVPNASVACKAETGCSGVQSCLADGSAYSACQCAEPSTTSSSQGSTSATGAGGGSTSSSTSSTGGAGGGTSWTPKNIPGVVLWLESGVGVTMDPQHPGTVLHWQDQSGSGVETSPVNTQDGFRFDYDPGALNGHDAIHCRGNGTWLDIPDAASLRWGSGDFAIAMVVKGDSLETSSTRYWEKDAGQAKGLSFTLNGAAFELDVAQSSVVVPLEQPSLFHVAIMRGQTLRMEVDALMGTGPTADINVDNPGASVHICSAGQSAQAVEVAEVIAVGGTLSDSDVAKLGHYLKQKFAL